MQPAHCPGCPEYGHIRIFIALKDMQRPTERTPTQPHVSPHISVLKILGRGKNDKTGPQMPNRRRRTLWSSTTTATIPIDRPTTAVTPPPQKSLAWACPLPSNADGEARRQPPFATFKARAVSKRKGRCGRPCSALRPSDCLRPLLCVLGLTPTGLWPLFLRPSSRVEIEAVTA